MCLVKYAICPDTNEQVNPESKIWLPNIRSILKPIASRVDRDDLAQPDYRAITVSSSVPLRVALHQLR